ncbi:MAG: nuclear transport factor 2 family protein [Comamonadaceae bacterium]|nr:MAG: nuclear transport factor 2 family protein [Comamonadaceae bacterium]
MNTVETAEHPTTLPTAATTAPELAARYIAAWNATEDAQRGHLVRSTFSSEVQYRDPMMEGRGHDGLAALIAGTQQRFAGHRFTLLGTPEGHHDVLRFSWALAAEGAEPVARGTDVAELDAHGRMCRVTGFLDYVAGA